MADPEFPRGGAPIFGGGRGGVGGAPTYDFAKFSQKLHELKEFGPPLDPPLKELFLSYDDLDLIVQESRH